MTITATKINIFIAYAREDAAYLKELRKEINYVLFFSFPIFVLLGCGGSSNEISTQTAWYQYDTPHRINSTIPKIVEDSIFFYLNTSKNPTLNQLSQLLRSSDDYKLRANYFTGYLVNTTDSTFTIKSQDGSLIMIQEALDTKGNWKPIEHWFHSGCMSSYFGPLKLRTNQFVMIPIRKYEGEFETKIRLKWLLNGKIVYSQPFQGSIDMQQFRNLESDTDDMFIKSSYLEMNLTAPVLK